MGRHISTKVCDSETDIFVRVSVIDLDCVKHIIPCGYDTFVTRLLIFDLISKNDKLTNTGVILPTNVFM